ncbi:MAG: PDZ domain-containing protein [Acidobacteria bacterium]|nr:PDZ domain-containing protein [Acidobacteriota bacterium]MYJ05229.1 PDZ domain-containing protein [Acidobacteriota bacterium]
MTRVTRVAVATRVRPALTVGRAGARLLALVTGAAAVFWLAAVPVALAGQSSNDNEALDAAVERFWASATDAEFAAASSGIFALDPDIESVWPRLRAGRTYRDDVPTGRQLLARANRDGVEHPYIVRVPDSYDPAVRYPLVVYLHGGVSRPKRDDGSWWRREERLARDDAIVVAPLSWAESLWWEGSQVENLIGVVHDLKRTYNIDENRVHMIGVSDGATGGYYQAMTATTPWAGFILLIGHPVVLANPASEVDADLHVTNLRNKPLFVVNGGRDRLYPAATVIPFMRLFQDAGVFLDFRARPEAGHNTDWWDDEAEAMTAFMAEQTRRSLPPRVSWETGSTDRFNRAHWLVIDELGGVDGEPELDPYNTILDPNQGMQLGINMIGELQDGTGLRVLEVGEDSIASAGGMVDNDTIVAVDGQFNPSVDDLKEALIGFAPGQRIPLVIERSGERLDVALVYPADAAPQGRQAFPRRNPAGRVELDQRGNRVNVYTRGVRRFTLLLSPEQFDFTQPIMVSVNGVTAFDGMVEPDVEALLRWAAIDQDRTAMFGAELPIDVPPAP